MITALMFVFSMTVCLGGKPTGKITSNTKDFRMPLLDNKGVPLVAMLDVETINKNMKAFIEDLVDRVLIQKIETIVDSKLEIFKRELELNNTNDDIKADISQLEKSINVTLLKQQEMLQQLLDEKSKTGFISKEVAYGKSATQSSQFGKGDFPAKNAVDGNLNTFSHTQSSDVNPYWYVDLGKTFSVSRIEIYSRTVCCGKQLHDFDVSVGGSPNHVTLCRHHKGPTTPGQHLIFHCNQPLVGQYVKVSTAGNAMIQLGEVKVYALVKSD